MKNNVKVKMAGLSIRKKLMISFGIILVLMLVMSANSLYRLNEARDKISKIVTEDYPTTAMGNNLIRAANASSIDLLNILVETRPAEIAALKQQIEGRTSKISELYTTLNQSASDAQSQSMLHNITAVRQTYIQSRGNVLTKLESSPQSAIAEYVSITKPAEEKYTAAINEFIELQRDEMQTSYEDFLRDFNTSRVVMSGLLILCLAIGIILSIIISGAIVSPLNHAVEAASRIAAGDLGMDIKITSRDETGLLARAIHNMQEELRRIVTDIRSGAENIATGATQIMSGTRDLSARTEEQASSIEETAASMEQISSTVKNTSDNTVNAVQLSEMASSAAKNNGKMMASLTHEIQNISGSAEKMSDIINLIDSIAFQTNILALNAAVEAARAGEHGRGFAVVAEEVRNLAQKTTVSSKDIRALILNANEQTERGLAMVKQVNTQMDEMVVNVDSVTHILKEIEQASNEQSDGIHQIHIAIGQIDTTTQQNAALVEESVAASAMLNDQASAMNKLVSVFRLSAA
ncbi:methyl-accepting chemotaxis protein [Phytobacter sp. AG2a]